jgi:predicted O-methyltransferase YrrM
MPEDSAALSEAEVAAWNAGKSYTSDWTTWHFPIWERVFGGDRTREARVLEIGSWEGRSALFFLNYFQHCRLTCVDTWGGSAEHLLSPTFAALVPDAERRFDDNVAEFSTRIEKIKAPSATALAQLGITGRKFDIVYVDGSHYAADVYADALLTWPMVARRGVMIFDDYQWDQMTHAHERPKLGIDAFLSTVEGKYRELLRAYQVIVRKL